MLVRALLLPVLLAGAAAAAPFVGVPPALALATEEAEAQGLPASRSQVLVVTTSGAPPVEQDEAVVPLGSAKERSRFLLTLLMLESLSDKPGSGVKLKIKPELLADEEVMQEILRLYESQHQGTKGKPGKPYIKIPPKLLGKIKRKMKELLSE